MKLVLDFDSWTMGEIERLEMAAGQSLAQIIDTLQAGEARIGLVVALVYASEARTNPAFTIDDARALRLSQVEITAPEAGGDPLVPPTGA